MASDHKKCVLLKIKNPTSYEAGFFINIINHPVQTKPAW